MGADKAYACGSRAVMGERVLASLFGVVGHGRHLRTINCHHNFTQLEHHHGKDLWITPQGRDQGRCRGRGRHPGLDGEAFLHRERAGLDGVVRVVRARCRRRMSRTAARKNLTVDSLREAMAGRSWNADSAEKLLDEHPASYKDIDEGMADQADLVSVQHTLRQVFNDKSVWPARQTGSASASGRSARPGQASTTLPSGAAVPGGGEAFCLDLGLTQAGGVRGGPA